MQRARLDFTKWLKCILVCLLSALQWSIPSSAAAQSDNFSIGNFVKVGEKRISRTVYEYTYQAAVTNIGPPVASAAAVVTSRSTPHTTVVAGTLNFANVAYLTPTSSSNSFTIRQDRLQPFDWNNLAWQFSSVLQTDVDATSKFIFAADGGTITSTNARGDQVTLEIPPGALAASELIKLTMLEDPQESPISNKHLPGVYLEPHGLILKKSARLKVVFANQLVDPDLVLIACLKSSSLALAIPNQLARNDTVEGDLIHFSTYAIKEITDEALDQLRNLVLSNAYRIISQVQSLNAPEKADDIMTFIDLLNQAAWIQRKQDVLGIEAANGVSLKELINSYVSNLLTSPIPTNPTNEYFLALEKLEEAARALDEIEIEDQLHAMRLINVEILPRIAHLWPGRSVSFYAQARDLNGNVTPISVTWTSSNSSIAACSSSTGTQTEVTTSDAIDSGEVVITAHYQEKNLSLTSKVIINRPDIVGYSTGPGARERHGWLISKGDTVEYPPSIPRRDGWTVFSYACEESCKEDNECLSHCPVENPYIYQWWQPTGINNNGTVLSLIFTHIPHYYNNLSFNPRSPDLPPGPVEGLFHNSFVYDSENEWEDDDGKPLNYEEGFPGMSLLATGINDSNMIVAYNYLWDDKPPSLSPWEDFFQGDQRRFLHRHTETWLYRLTTSPGTPNWFFVDTQKYLTQLPEPPGSPCGFAPTGMNNKGLIVGWSWCQGTGYVIDASRFIEALLRGRSIWDLNPHDHRTAPRDLVKFTPVCIPLPETGVDGECGIPTGINDSGDIVGYYVVPGTNYNHGFVLRSYQVVPEYLPDPPHKNGWRPTGINNSGQIIGHSGTDGYLLDDGGEFTTFSGIVPMALTK